MNFDLGNKISHNNWQNVFALIFYNQGKPVLSHRNYIKFLGFVERNRRNINISSF